MHKCWLFYIARTTRLNRLHYMQKTETVWEEQRIGEALMVAVWRIHTTRGSQPHLRASVRVTAGTGRPVLLPHPRPLKSLLSLWSVESPKHWLCRWHVAIGRGCPSICTTGHPQASSLPVFLASSAAHLHNYTHIQVHIPTLVSLPCFCCRGFHSLCCCKWRKRWRLR